MSWIFDNLDLIGRLTLEHVRLSVPPIVLGLIFAIPLGWFAYRFRLTRSVLLTAIGLLYTIPSLALFVILPPLLGIGFLSELNITIALTIYAVAILARSVTDALGAVDPDVRQSAIAIGYSGWRRFWGVELPLAGPIILAGLRVAAVSTVSLVTVGILVGVESLGYLFTNGLQRRIIAEVFAGVAMTVIVALLIDALLVLLGRALMPWTRADSRATPKVADPTRGAAA
ncbi:ABC transporter permease [Planctomonas psychrotolerans]|uniref:ABC transporter permease n=1 Tax=Planctomonas psychrotolerans TaxID=2528712 RepID=UPI00123A9C1F|nr:ABC transporter permease [Planctomonas psychrotolerans]